MTLGKWLKQIDIESLSITSISLWIDSENVGEPLWEGRASEIPWLYLDYKISITDPDDPTTKPIMIFAKQSEYGTYLPHLIITVEELY